MTAPDAARPACNCAQQGHARLCPVHTQGDFEAADRARVDAARPAVSVEDVLAAHGHDVEERVNADDASLRDYGARCTCGQWNAFDHAESHRAHVAAALAEAGIGDVAEARDREWDRIVDALAGRANDLHAARAEGAQAVLDAVEVAYEGENRDVSAKACLAAARAAAADQGAS